MAFDAGAAVGTLGLDVSGYTRGILEAQSLAGIFPSVVTNFLANPLLGIIGLAKDAASAIKGAFLEIGAAADNAGEAAERAGVSVEFLTGVGAVAADAGSSVQGLADSMKFLANNAADAAGGNKTTQKAFADLGISVVDAGGKLKNNETLFFEVADAIASIDDPAKKTQAAMNLLGRGGTELIPTLNKGSSGIKDFAKVIADLGGTIDGDLADAGDKFGTLETLVGAAWKGIKKSVAEPILLFFRDHMAEVVEGVKSFSGWIREGIGHAFETIGPIVKGAGAFFSGFGSTVGSLVSGAFNTLVPLLGSAFELLSGLAQIVGSVLVPVFRILAPVLKVVADILGFIMEVIGKVLGGIASVIRGVTDAVGLTTPTAESGGGAGSSGGGGAGSVTNNFNTNLHLQPLDEKKAAHEIAQTVAVPIQEKMRADRSALQSAALSSLTARSL